MATNENKIITQGECNKISPPITVFSGTLTKCPTKSEINSTKKKIVLEAGVNSNRKNITLSYKENQLVRCPDVGHYVICTHDGTITDIPYIEFLYNNQVVESFYPFTEQGVTGNETSFVLGLTSDFFEYDWSQITIRASFGNKTNSLSYYKLNGYSGEKNSEGTYFIWNTTYANNILDGLINHNLDVFVDENSYGTELEITPSTSSIYVGNTTNFKAVYYTTTNGIRDDEGVDVTETAVWSTSTSSVATVSKGVVTGKGEGSATITASYSGVSDDAVVGVSNYISINPTTLAFVAIGESKSITVSASSAFNVSESLDWLSYTTNGDTVLFTAVENQSTDTRSGSVTFTCGTKKATLNVSQSAATVSYELEVTPSSGAVIVGNTIEYSAIYYEYRNNKYYTDTDVTSDANWTTDADSIATVSKGVVTGKGEGNCIITASYNGKTDTAEVDVSNTISINPTNLTFIAAGETKSVTVSATSSFSVSEGLDWLTYTINGDTVSFTAAENKTTSARNGSVTFTCGSEKVTLSVSQSVASVSYKLVLNPTSGSIYVGDTMDFTATYYEYRNGALYAETDVTSYATWSTSTSSIATVSKGVVNGKGEGDVEITATYNGISESVTINVANYISINPTALTFIALGEVKNVTVSSSSSFNVSEGLDWLTYTTNGNTVSFTASENQSTSVRSGKVTFTCGSEVVELSVSQNDADVSYGLEISPKSNSMAVGGTVNFTAIYYEYRNNKYYTDTDVTSTATWTTDAASIATVSKGVVTGKGEGSTTIGVTYNGESASATVSVSNYISISPTDLHFIAAGESKTVTVTAPGSFTITENLDWLTYTINGNVVTFTASENKSTSERSGSVEFACGSERATLSVSQDDATVSYELFVTPISASTYVGETVNFIAVYYEYRNDNYYAETDVTSVATWTSSANTVATVSKGSVTGKGEGNTTITALYNGKTDTATINVANYISINPTALTFVATGGTKSVTVSASSVFSVSESLDWLTYTTNGNTVSFTAVENQTTSARSGSVTFTCGSKKATLNVSQNAATVSYGLEISPKSNSISIGGTANFTATYCEYRNNKYYTGTDVTSSAIWSSSATSIATVSKGVVTGVSEGNTTITASYSGKSNTATVSVSTYISINPTNLVFIAAGESKTVTVSAPGPFEVSENLEWLTYTTNGNVVTFTASENTSTVERSGKVTFTCGSEVVELSVLQNDADVSYGLYIEPSSGMAYVGETIDFTAYYYEYRNGKYYEKTDVTSYATWASNSTTIASVSKGVVTCKVEGRTNITATYSNLSDSAEIEVYNYISINPTELNFAAVGETKSVTVYASSSFNVSESLSWLTYTINGNTVSFTASENTSTVGRSGVVTFTCGSETATLNVSQDEATVSYSLYIEPSSGSAYVGDIIYFTAYYYEYRNGDYYGSTNVTSAATWTSSLSSVATVSKGTVTCKDDGNATITASYYGESADVPVIVLHSSPTLTVSPTEIYLNETGDTGSFTVNASNYESISASKSGSWFTLSKTSGTGTHTVSANENPYSSKRTGSVTITCVGLDGSEIEKVVAVTQYASEIDTYLIVSPSSDSMYVGDSINLTATYYYELNGTTTTEDVTSTATWTTSAASIATVSKGVVTGKGEGSTTIYATYNGESDSATVSVSYPSPTLTVTPTSVYIDEAGGNGSFTVSASNYASISASQSGSWFTLSKTSGTGTYTVSANENPNNTQRTGSVTITCVGLDGSELNKTIDIIQYASDITYYLTVSPSTTSVNVGSTVSLTAKYYCTLNGNVISTEDVTSKATWSSNSESNATVSSGVVKGITGGTATVTATYNGSSDSCDITVNDVYTYNFYISTWTTPINVGDTRTYKGFLETRKNGVLSTSEITTSWKSSNTSVATISSGGIVTGLKSGTTTITGTATLPNGNTATDSRDQDVNSVTYSLVVSPSSITIEVGETYQLAATYYTIINGVSDSGIDVTSDATWGSGSATYVSVNGSGLVTGEKNTYGNTFNVTATYNGKSDKCGVIVTAPSATLTSLSVEPCYGASGTYSKVSVTAGYSDGSTKNVTSACTLTITNSSPNGVATISGNQVQHGAVGTATLNASYTENGITKTATASVTTVKVMGDRITPTPSSVSIGVGETASVTLEGVLNNGVEFDGTSCVYTYSPSYCSVSKSGNTFIITGINKGSGSSITFQHSTGGASCVVAVTVTSNTTLPEVYVTNAYVEQIEEGTTSTIRLVLEMNDGSTIYPGGSYKILGTGPGGPSVGTGGSIPMTFDTSNGIVNGGIEMTTSSPYYEANGTYDTITRQAPVYFPIIT